MALLVLRLSCADSKATLLNKLSVPASATQFDDQQVDKYLGSVFEGGDVAAVTLRVGDVQAVNALTLASMVATDTVTVNGVVFTCVASGATGNQFNVGGTDTITAANLAAAVNASTSAKIKNAVTATSDLAVVSFTAVEGGAIGNLFTLAASAHATPTGANFASGADGTVVPNINYGLKS